MKECIEKSMKSPGWIRLFKVISGLWLAILLTTSLGLLVTGKGQSAVGLFLFALAGPLVVYIMARLLAWIVRGFLE